MQVPTGKSSLTFSLSGGSGDADLYIERGGRPTQTSYQCHSVKSGNAENCTVASPVAGDWYVMLRGYSKYAGASLLGHTQ